MANFKVGQRVRKVANPKDLRADNCIPVGAVGTIREYRPELHYYWRIEYDGHAPQHDESVFGPYFGAREYMFAPLTDPGADEFIENMERFSRVTRRVPSPVQ